MGLLRIFIPSWRFFDELGQVATLSHRTRLFDNTEFGAWENSITKPTPSPAAFLFNPSGNLYLASQALVGQLMVDIQNLQGEPDPSLLENRCSFLLVQKYVEQQVRKNNPLQSSLHYQFKISVVDPNQPQNDYEALISKEYSL